MSHIGVGRRINSSQEVQDWACVLEDDTSVEPSAGGAIPPGACIRDMHPRLTSRSELLRFLDTSQESDSFYLLIYSYSCTFIAKRMDFFEIYSLDDGREGSRSAYLRS